MVVVARGAREDEIQTQQNPTEREQILQVLGVDPISGMVGPNGRMIGRFADMQLVKSWKEDLGLTFSEVLAVVSGRHGPEARRATQHIRILHPSHAATRGAEG